MCSCCVIVVGARHWQPLPLASDFPLLISFRRTTRRGVPCCQLRDVSVRVFERLCDGAAPPRHCPARRVQTGCAAEQEEEAQGEGSKHQCWRPLTGRRRRRTRRTRRHWRSRTRPPRCWRGWPQTRRLRRPRHRQPGGWARRSRPSPWRRRPRRRRRTRHHPPQRRPPALTRALPAASRRHVSAAVARARTAHAPVGGRRGLEGGLEARRASRARLGRVRQRGRCVAREGRFCCGDFGGGIDHEDLAFANSLATPPRDFVDHQRGTMLTRAVLVHGGVSRCAVLRRRTPSWT